MIGGNHVIKYRQAEPLFSLEEPLQPALAVLGKPEQELSLMAAMGDMPYLAWNMMAIRSWHLPPPVSLEAPFKPRKDDPKH